MQAESESFWEKFKSCCAKTDNENNADSDSSSQTDSLSISESESYSKFAAKIFHFALESEHRAYKVCCRSPIAATLKLISWLMCCCAGQPLRRGKVWFSRTRLSFGREKDKVRSCEERSDDQSEYFILAWSEATRMWSSR